MQGDTALHLAVYFDAYEVAMLLIQHDADINARNNMVLESLRK